LPQLQHRAEIEIQPEDRELFRELGISTPLQLALIKPKKYRDFNLYLFPLEGEPQLFEARILSVHQYKKIVKVRFHLLNLNRIVEGIYFKIPSWYWKYLKEGEQIFIWGELQERQISQPWIVSKKGEIEPVYPKTSLPPRTLRKLIKKYVTPDTLYPLPPQIALPLYRSHFPKTRQDIYPATIDYIYKWAEVCNYLYRLRKRRVYRPAPVSDRNPAPFIASLPFQLTRDQLKAINQVREDLRSPYQRRRVIIGDVGSGKTIVMLAIAYMAEKSAIMCPTSILANQIYEEAEKYLTPLGLKVVLVTQNSGATDEEINSADLLVGTHALLYRELPPLKAISIDEQHRFGTAQRRKLEELGATATLRPHHFQFSATPIPRTQALIQSNFVEVTLIKELPFKKEIETRVLPKDREGVLELLTLLKGEIEKGKQGIIVYPAVEGESTNLATLQKGRKFWEKYFSKVLVTHGKDREKEEILLKFREEGELLVTTTIIEVGISLPRLSVIAIVDADHFGLATLHQLRGRVGRYGEKGYCYLLTDNPHNPRLVQFSKILDGFQIAELDLKFRRAGDLLEGSHQSGESFRYFDEVEDREILEEVHNYLNTLEEPPAVVEPTNSLSGEKLQKEDRKGESGKGVTSRGGGEGEKVEQIERERVEIKVKEGEKGEFKKEKGEKREKEKNGEERGEKNEKGKREQREEGVKGGVPPGERGEKSPEITHSGNLNPLEPFPKVEREGERDDFSNPPSPNQLNWEKSRGEKENFSGEKENSPDFHFTQPFIPTSSHWERKQATPIVEEKREGVESPSSPTGEEKREVKLSNPPDSTSPKEFPQGRKGERGKVEGEEKEKEIDPPTPSVSLFSPVKGSSVLPSSHQLHSNREESFSPPPQSDFEIPPGEKGKGDLSPSSQKKKNLHSKIGNIARKNGETFSDTPPFPSQTTPNLEKKFPLEEVKGEEEKKTPFSIKSAREDFSLQKGKTFFQKPDSPETKKEEGEVPPEKGNKNSPLSQSARQGKPTFPPKEKTSSSPSTPSPSKQSSSPSNSSPHLKRERKKLQYDLFSRSGISSTLFPELEPSVTSHSHSGDTSTSSTPSPDTPSNPNLSNSSHSSHSSHSTAKSPSPSTRYQTPSLFGEE